MSFSQLLVALDMNQHIGQSTEDIRKILVLRSNIHLSAEAAAISILRTSIFNHWLQPRHCDMLLIEDVPSASSTFDFPGRVSDKSILCAILISSIARGHPGSFQLFFFCGLHTSDNDPLSNGPRDIMRSLIYELAREAYGRH
jgi:hypothetical protein